MKSLHQCFLLLSPPFFLHYKKKRNKKNKMNLKEKPLFILDLDETVANLVKCWVERLNAIYGTKFNHQDIQNYDLYKDLSPLTREQCSNILSEPGLFRNLEVILGARDFVTSLNRIGEIVVATALPLCNPVTAAHDKLAWIEENLKEIKRENVIFTYRKDLLCQGRDRKTFIIDDNLKMLNSIKNNEVYKVIIEQPWNSDPLLYRFPIDNKCIRTKDWDRIIQFIEDRVSND